ncbi:MAG TPA: DUF4294 domain-containing protein [Saprospiraceae bacterium]|nr:DUF4294 domain-containing protein [Saprospiraceae bacterium]HND89182.1 DUF4294 domain-containing protein [Saprospiraceae bacterium]HNG90787.1 DUF4294 domain-containing protein [Saprospiraceae bacterium]
MKNWIFLLGFALFAPALAAQTPDTLPKGAWARMEVENGDTVFVMSLRMHRVSSKRQFKDFAEQRQYFLYYRAAKRVYPYAVQAIDLYNDIQAETKDMSKRQRKKHIKREHKEMKEDMTEQMKKLSRTEGKVLIKMIERQLNKNFYGVIKETRGAFTASYWNQMAKIWDYDLKQGYQVGNDPLLDEILLDYDFGEAVWWR